MATVPAAITNVTGSPFAPRRIAKVAKVMSHSAKTDRRQKLIPNRMRTLRSGRSSRARPRFNIKNSVSKV